jgi:hypothetical protein
MKKFLGKTLLVAIVMGLGIFAWSTMVNAQLTTQVGKTTAGTFWVNSDKTLIEVIKSFINRVLLLLSLIALAIALYGGFKMVTAAGDEGKYKEGFKILKQAAVGLIIVWLSWVIVSTVFWLVLSFKDATPPAWGV